MWYLDLPPNSAKKGGDLVWYPRHTQKTTFEIKMWSKTHIWTNLRFLCEIDQKVLIFVVKLKKMQSLKMTFKSQLEPSIKSYECFMFCKISDLEITLDWWILEWPSSLFFFQKPRKIKNALYYQKKPTIFLWNWSKSLNFCWKTQKNATSKNDL